MKIKVVNNKPLTLQQFAEAHGFELVVEQREKKCFTCCFEGLEVKEGGVLASYYGRGETMKQAMLDYARQISEQLLVANAYSDLRTTYSVPKLKY